MRESIEITVPETSDEMTLDQLCKLMRGDIESLIGLKDEDKERASLVDLVRVAEAWTNVKLHPCPPNEVLYVDGKPYMINSFLHERSVEEMIMFDEALQAVDIAMLVALHTRPCISRKEFLKQLNDAGQNPSKRLQRATRGKKKYLPMPFDAKDCYGRAKLFRSKMTASQALYVTSVFAAMGSKLLSDINGTVVAD